ncbi:MAG: hypothetical protein M1814_000785 [Vezdaea aestivalis]|nr:MAG: hypothetical protein M1814_000785 [Vezdaea aestivalis]
MQHRPKQQATNATMFKPSTGSNNSHMMRPHKPQPARLKVVVRRLPSGLSKEDFFLGLGPDWTLTGGKIDWFMYKVGKTQTDPTKVPRYARAYLHLTDAALLEELSRIIKSNPFPGAKIKSTTNSLLVQPALGFSPFGKIPNKTSRIDARQGLIDQDNEFISFLESLTTPIAPRFNMSVEESSAKEEKTTATPLIQHLQEVKASKAKDGRGAKHAKHIRNEGKEKAGDKQSSAKGNPQTLAGDSRRRGKDLRFEKASKETVKILNKEAGRLKGNKPNATLSVDSPNESQSVAQAKVMQETPTGPSAARKRERGNLSAAARILQRDLGLVPNNNSRRQGRNKGSGTSQNHDNKASLPSTPQKQASAPENPKPESKDDVLNSSGIDEVVYPPEDEQFVGVGDIGTEVEAKGPAAETAARDAAHRRKRGPAPKPGTVPQMILKKPVASPTPNSPAVVPPKAETRALSLSGAPSGPAAASSSKAEKPKGFTDRFPHAPNQAFLKHANPSQGITEELIQAALEIYGSISKVNIDTKKGFAYVNFASREGLIAAIKASPVKVAQGQVQVLERIEKKGHTFRKDDGGGTQGGRARAAKGIVKTRGSRVGGGNNGGSRGGRGSGTISQNGAVGASGLGGNRPAPALPSETAAT